MFEDPSFISLFSHASHIISYDLLFGQTLLLRFLLKVYLLVDSVLSVFYQVMLKTIRGNYCPMLKLHQALFAFFSLILGKSYFEVITTI